MLVLSRKERESIVFTSLGITIDVVKISGKKVRLGIQAPPEIPVHRKELAERMARQADNLNEVAASHRILRHEFVSRLPGLIFAMISCDSTPPSLNGGVFLFFHRYGTLFVRLRASMKSTAVGQQVAVRAFGRTHRTHIVNFLFLRRA